MVKYPEDWKVVPIKKLAVLKAGKACDLSQMKPGPYPCFGGNGIRGWYDHYDYEGNFPIVGRQGELCGNVKKDGGGTV